MSETDRILRKRLLGIAAAVNGRTGVLVAAAFALACEGATVRGTACRGLADRKMGITGAEYSACADELVSALDSLRSYLSPLVSEEAMVFEPANRTYRRLRLLIQETGVMRDYRSLSGAEIERWPEGAVRGFNRAVFGASVQYGSALDAARRSLYEDSRGNFAYAASLHDQAQEFRRNFR